MKWCMIREAAAVYAEICCIFVIHVEFSPRARPGERAWRQNQQHPSCYQWSL